MDSKISKSTAEEIENFLAETGFEIWNAGATHRMHSNYSTDGFEVCTFSFHPVKTFKTLKGALQFMEKQDQL